MRANVTSNELGGSTNLAVLAPVKPGFVVGFESITYLERLHKLLAAVNASRRAQREAALTPPVFPDPIGRFGIIRNFRYTVFPPYPPDPHSPLRVDPDDPHWLTLNITFDGGWEPYMRVIYRDIGPLLDALFSNCVGYPGSRTASYDDYCRWVRDNETPHGTFFSDAPITVADQHYFEETDRLQRGADPVHADAAIAAFALPSDNELGRRALATAKADPEPAVLAALRGVKGLYRLSPYFPPNDEREDLILVRFARQVLPEFHRLLPAVRAGQFGVGAKALLDSFVDELDWFTQPDTSPPPAAGPEPAYDPTRVQAGIVAPYDGITHGCLVLLRVEPGAGDAAARFLANYDVSVEGRPAKDAIRRNVALSYVGLQSLGVHEARIDKLAPEFAQGMETRAGLLGDFHGNHPDVWPRPKANWDGRGLTTNGGPVDLSAVDVVIALRVAGHHADPSPGLHALLAAEIQAIESTARGALKVIGVEPMRSYPDAPGGKGREHFGFLDGFSQPVPASPLPQPRQVDQVPVGEIVLGYRNDRGDAPGAAASEDLMLDGSYLVVRKLRQHLDALHTVIEREWDGSDVLERMVGRRRDGTPLVQGGLASSNAFNYEADAHDKAGARCPFHAHTRRTNPRDGRPATPRIMRRGMSYGARSTGPADRGDDRGIVFMAYCASVAEQFEVIQRWIAGGNSSGVSSSQADPLLGVPVPGQTRAMRYLREDGSVRRVDLGSKPFVSLQWGMYLFAPSPAALKKLSDLRLPPSVTHTRTERPTDHPDAIEQVRRKLEDPERSRAYWTEVRKDGDAGKSTAYGRLIGTESGVRKVLLDDGTRYSVCGYGARMAESIGHGYLGQDGAAHDAPAGPVNAAIAVYDEKKAFAAARPAVDAGIRAFMRLAQASHDPAGRVPLDLVSLSEGVLAELCRQWFGLPDGALMKAGGRVPGVDAPARCPGHLQTTSRYIFSSRPSEAVRSEGEAQGAKVLEAFRSLLKSGGTLGPLAADIRNLLTTNKSIPAQGLDELIAVTIAGTMLGFPPTVHGNFLRVMVEWQKSDLQKCPVLWKLQMRLLEAKAATPDPFARADAVLRPAILAAMAENPLPETIWRTDKTQPAPNDPKQPEGEALTVLGLASAMREPGADPYLMFGGDYSGKQGTRTPHACPGYGMAIGVLLALVSGLLEAGTLRPTASPVALTLIAKA